MRFMLLRVAFLGLALSAGVLIGHAESVRLDPVLRAMMSPMYRANTNPEELSDSLPLTWEGLRSVAESVGVGDYERLPGGWGGIQVNVLVHVEDTYAGFLPGVSIQGRHGPFLTGLVPVSGLEELAAHPAVIFVEAARPVQTMLDVSVEEVRADLAWAGSPGVTGQGVIVGVVDTGLDITHSDFRVDRSGDGYANGSRVVALWDQTVAADGSAASYDFGYGRVYARSQLEDSLAANTPLSRDTFGHGTHVASIAAGAGAVGMPGVAVDAELVVVRSTYFTDSIVDGVAFVFRVAEQEGYPAVVNLSLGGHSGPHDGTSNFERAIDALVDRPGRAVVVAAGNDGDRKIHVGGDVRSSTTWHLQTLARNVPVEFWHEGDVSFKVSVTAPCGERVTAQPGMTVLLETAAGTLWLDNPLHRDARNSDKVVYVELQRASQHTEWAISFAPWGGSGGRVDGWVTDTRTGSFREGDGRSTISEPGNARRVITVGAYTTKEDWVSIAGPQIGHGVSLGTLAYFSSHGPTRDGRLKPDMTAPGAWIGAALSKDSVANPQRVLSGGHYQMMAGTSMATPHVTGAVALVLGLQNSLDWSELVQILASSSRVDPHTGPVPNRLWGWGKLDVFAALGEEAAVQYELTIGTQGHGDTVPVPGVHNYNAGLVVSVKALPAVGWVFDRWVGPVADVNKAATTIKMEDRSAITAVFAKATGTVCRELGVGWNLLSLPVEQSPDELVIEPEPTFSYTYCWDPSTGRYLAAHRGEVTVLGALSGFWLYIPRDAVHCRLCMADPESESEQMVRLGRAGWQMIGVPYAVAWGGAEGGSLTVRLGQGLEKALIEALSAGWILGTLYAWNPADGSWIRHRATDGTTLSPSVGYFIYTLEDDLELIYSRESPSWPTGTALSPVVLVDDPGDPPMPALLGLPYSERLEVLAFPSPASMGQVVTFAARGAMIHDVEAISVHVRDLSGRQVFEGESMGDEVVWNTREERGQLVSSGVYLYTVWVKLDGVWSMPRSGKFLIVR